MGWKLTYAHDRLGKPVSGRLADLIAAIESGCEARICIDYAQDGPPIYRDLTALWIKEGQVYAQSPPVVSCCFENVYVGGDTATVGPDYEGTGLRFLDNPYYYFEIVSTRGDVDKSRWGIADHKLRRRNQGKFAMRWFTRE
ncbi:MAG: hypothetical protein K8S99_16095 [Planctomycetes bacterium]|nr:hypothetical protein [Planctomycetota bacterium]